MTATNVKRKPVPELSVLLLGGILFAVSSYLEIQALLVASVFLCIFSGIAALISSAVAPRSRAVKATITVVGSAGAIFGVVWWMAHGDEPEIFSPIFVGYIGGGLALSGICNLLHDQVRRV